MLALKNRKARAYFLSQHFTAFKVALMKKDGDVAATVGLKSPRMECAHTNKTEFSARIGHDLRDDV